MFALFFLQLLVSGTPYTPCDQRRCPKALLCQDGACVSHCKKNRSACNGRCVDLLRDPRHCGACSMRCPSGARCVGEVCRCPPNTRLCHNACVDLRRNSRHCGKCGYSCGPKQMCQQGVCVGKCLAGETRCGRRCARLHSDRRDCGACGKACASDESCVNKRCIKTKGAVIHCGGYAYPLHTYVSKLQCTGWFKHCTGTHLFRVAGCFKRTPKATACPSGYTVATLMLIGQWAEAADIRRYAKDYNVCMYAGGLTAHAACGGSHVAGYCWPRGAACKPQCPSNCCHPGVQCNLQNPHKRAPLLCVR